MTSKYPRQAGAPARHHGNSSFNWFRCSTVCVNVGKKKKNADLSCKKVTEVISTIVLLCFCESVSALATYINSV